MDPTPVLDPHDRRQRLLRRRVALQTERSSWVDHWREIASYQTPRTSRFFVSETNRGTKRHNSILENTAIFAHRTLAAGMMSGMTSPARPWFRLALRDRDLMEFAPVKAWLYDVVSLMRAVFSASNTYQALHQCYEEIGAFGTWANFVQPNFDNVIHHLPLTVGEYTLATDELGHVNTLQRDAQMTVGQMVRQFGRSRVSTHVRNLYDRGVLDAWVPIYHFVMPREEFDPRKRDALNMPFASIYMEAASNSDSAFLSESGFKRFPALCPRWRVLTGNVYGDSPGMECLGDVKQLQLEQLRKAQAIDYQVNPPLQVPIAYRDQANKRLPGGVMFVDQNSPGGGVRTAYEVNVRLDYLLADIQDTRERIRSAYYADLFLMLANQPADGRMTATEVAERHEEKLLMLGPVLERLQTELLSPLIDITFDRMVEAQILPPAPPELQGQDLNVEFISTLAQAQRAVAAGGMDRLLSTVGQVVQIWPEMRHKINALQVVDDYADMYGVNPKVIASDEEAQARVDAERQAAQAAQQGAAMAQAVDSAKTASEIDSEGARDVLNMFQGYNSPSATEV